VVISNELVKLVDVPLIDPHGFTYVCTKACELDCVKVDLVKNLPPSIVKHKPYAFIEGYLSVYYMLT